MNRFLWFGQRHNGQQRQNGDPLPLYQSEALSSTQREETQMTSESRHRVACITGANGGVGKALALAIAREGYDLVLVGRHEDQLGAVAERLQTETGSRAHVCALDISDASRMPKLEAEVRAAGGLDVLINAAAVFSEAPLSAIETADLVSLVDTIVKGTLLVTRQLLPMLSQRGGNILNFVSDWALPGSSGPSPFTAAKWAVAGMGEALAKEAISSGVKVTNLFPGDIASQSDPWETSKGTAQDLDDSSIPLRDIVATVMYVLRLQSARVLSVVIVPSDPEYLS